MLDTSISIKTDQFDGPLGLLLHLIQQDDLNIRDLNITSITKQYLEYLTRMQNLNFDIAGDYLYMAATLLLLKSKSCIAPEEIAGLINQEIGDGLIITSREELIARLEELEHYQRLGQKLWGLPRKGHDIFIKPKVNRKAIIDSVLTPIDLENLTSVMIEFMRKQKRKVAIIAKDKRSIKKKLVYLKEVFTEQKEYLFQGLIREGDQLGDIVLVFISLLELARLKKIQVFQNEDKGQIYINVVSDLKEFNVDLADGFDDEEEQGQEKTEDSDEEEKSETEEVIVSPS